VSKLKLDLHSIFNKGEEIEKALAGLFKEAVENRIEYVEIISGKGTGQLKKHVLRFLAKPEVKCLYHRLKKDDKNFGRIFVYFRHSNAKAYH
jgi:DNA-nicking Smr family endonuclease